MLIFNTYELKDRQYELAEKNVINDLYTTCVRNDKIYPGANPIVDHYMLNNIHSLKNLYLYKRNEFEEKGKLICDSLFRELRTRNNMDSVFSSFLRKANLRRDLQYLLTVENLTITFDGETYIPLYNKNDRNKEIAPEMDSPFGMIIGGKLKSPRPLNQITNLSISGPYAYSYQIRFCLYADRPNRYLFVLNQMLPTFALAFIAIFSVLLIYFITFRNWVKQKKLAEMKSDFVNSITHEFHTPIATIMVANKSLQNEKIASKKENLQNLTEVIARQTQRLQILFDQVLDITKINSSEMEKGEYNLEELMEEVLLDYRLKTTTDKVSLAFDKNTNSQTAIVLNRFWFTTMLYNILDNAIKYNNKTKKEISVSIDSSKKETEIHIKDNGIGMSPATVKHIYEKFYRGNKKDMKSVSGLGLGLFYAKQCIDAHGWRLSVSSEEAIGSEFIIFIS